MSFFELAKERFSVRNFSDKAIEEEKLNQIIQAGRVAPTAKNKQPQKIYVLQSKEAVEKVKTLSPCIYDAPTVLLICYDESAVWYNSRRPGYNSGEMDATIVCTHMMFAAWELGVGSCWVGVFDDKEVSATFELPENIKPVALLPIGYPAKDAVPNEKLHNSFRPQEETVIFL